MSKPLLDSFPAEVHRFIAPVVKLAKGGDAAGAEQALAWMALAVAGAVEAGRLSPQRANDYFVALDLTLDEQTEIDLSDDAKDLLMEGMHFHDWGTPHAPDLSLVRETAERISSAAVVTP